MNNFLAYIQISNNRYRENFGLHFEDFAVGQKFKHRPGVTLSQQDNKDEAIETINNAQLHYDAHYAAQTEWKNCLGVSTLTLQNILGMTWKTFGRQQRIIGCDDISMTFPVFGGDTLYAESEIMGKKDYPENSDVGIVEVITTGINQNQKVVCKIQYQILIYKKGKHPLDKNLQPDVYNLPDEKFSGYRKLADNEYMEQVGIYYEGFEIGETYEHFPARTFTAEESRMHALRSLEWNPLYADLNYIKKFNNDQFVIYEPFLIGVVTALTTRTFGRVVANLQWKNIQLPQPLYANETIHAESTILSKRESKSRPSQGIVQANTRAFNQDGKLVCSFERHFLIYKQGQGPYEAAGY